MEEYLLDCLEMLSRAGDDEVRRKKEITKSPSWELLDVEWKALAMIGAGRVAGDSVGIEAEVGGATRTRRVGRRGGRGRVRGIEDRVASPQSVIGSGLPPGYRLAVLIVQKDRMKGAWADGLDSAMETIREECALGIHPVWERLARESPLLAELGFFPVVQPEGAPGDSVAWIEGAMFDHGDFSSLREWLNMDVPQKLTASQMKVLKSIQRDLSGRARPSQWEEWMSPSLEGLSGDGGLLEGILLAACGSSKAISVLNAVEGDCSFVSSKHAELIRARRGDFRDWEEVSRCVDEDGLSVALRVESWRGFEEDLGSPSLEEKISGAVLLGNMGLEIPDTLRWSISYDLIEDEKKEEAIGYVDGANISSIENVEACLELLALDESGEVDRSLRKYIDETSEERGVLLILRHDGSTSSIRLHAAKKLGARDSIRHTDDIISAFTRTAEIGGLAKSLVEDKSLPRAYPFRAMMTWHLVGADEAAGIEKGLEEARKTALLSIDVAEEDGVLSDVSIGLISILDGITGNLDAVNKKLDHKGERALNEIRNALSPEGDDVVREKSIEALTSSVESTDLETIERRLFEALVNALILNRAAVDLQSGESPRRESAISSLESLVSDDSVSMKTIRFASDLVFEHRIGIESLDSWYNENNRAAVEHQVVRAAVLESKGDFAGSAWSHREAAMRTMEDDLEMSATFLRWSLISFAHGGCWKDAVSLIEEYPTISASVTKRFKLYLRVCLDQVEGSSTEATTRIIKYVSDNHENEDGEVVSRLESLESLLMYPDERNLPRDPFRGRVKAAKRRLGHTTQSTMTQLDHDFESAMVEGDSTLKLVTIIEQISEESSVRGLRLYERAIGSGKFDDAENKRLMNSQRILFTRQRESITIRERKNLKSLSLRPLVLIDTNILIDALKDDLLREISGDSLGSLDWTVDRAFHWMIRRRRDAEEVLLSIPKAAKREFLNRTKSPESVLGMFNNTYVDRRVWNEIVSESFLREKVDEVLSDFENWTSGVSDEQRSEVELESFLVSHEDIFRIVDQHKRERHDDIAPRTKIEGAEIYPEIGDCDIMREAAVVANSAHAGIGSIVVATRDSDFKLVSRALEESFGFGVVGDAQQLRLLS
ncbi:MAG: hypothetical protein CMB53_02845 [Euryarchaeota archaeon]|nr:hypothetical protein [Euryarchaeota archaeon]|tara:strand:+ start:26634 stop:29981 length:3348 start_codon:yes stop_codon:yes gene_type:complete